MAERHITLVRHGRYDRSAQVEGGGDLIADGIEQARMVASIIDQHNPVTHIYSSTQRRAVSTAHIIASRLNLGFTQTDVLCEAVFHIPDHHDALHHQLEGYTPEVVTAQRIRVVHAYATHVIAPSSLHDEHDVLVAHGNIIRYFAVRAMKAPIELWSNITVYNGGITRIAVNEDGVVRLVTHNEISHLPRRLWTTH